jgi:2-phosphoglycerate kinase
MDGFDRDIERELIKKKLRDISKREMIDVMKQAIKEVLHEQVTNFGWWSIRSLSILIIGGLALLAIYLGGWPK